MNAVAVGVVGRARQQDAPDRGRWFEPQDARLERVLTGSAHDGEHGPVRHLRSAAFD